MLVRADDLVIGQPAHAWVSGQLARAWGNPAFPAPHPREPVCLAAEQHDVGWAESDLSPLRDDDGGIVSFTAIPRSKHLAIWRGAAHRLLAQSRYAALLVSLHGTTLYDRWVDPGAYPPKTAAAIEEYLASQRRLQEELADGLDPAEVDSNRRLLATLDGLSLALCHDRAATLEDVPAAGGDAVMHVRAAEPGDTAGGAIRDDQAVAPGTATRHYTVDPWPFAHDRLAVGCEARRPAPGEPLASAPWVALRWELAREPEAAGQAP